jgi:hypothetical protein
MRRQMNFLGYLIGIALLAFATFLSNCRADLLHSRREPYDGLRNREHVRPLPNQG